MKAHLWEQAMNIEDRLDGAPDPHDGESGEPTPYAVLCSAHGRVFLRDAEYRRQMARPDSGWECPRMSADEKDFGLCGRPCVFDDETYEQRMNFEEPDGPKEVP